MKVADAMATLVYRCADQVLKRISKEVSPRIDWRKDARFPELNEAIDSVYHKIIRWQETLDAANTEAEVNRWMESVPAWLADDVDDLVTAAVGKLASPSACQCGQQQSQRPQSVADGLRMERQAQQTPVPYPMASAGPADGLVGGLQERPWPHTFAAQNKGHLDIR